MLTRRHISNARRRAGILGALLLAATAITVPDAASAEGFFDFLFGGPEQPTPPAPIPQHLPPPTPGVGRIVPAPLESERINEGGGSTGHGVAFCVRLCDGYHFPLEQMVKGTPAETCRAICPYSKTKVFFGAEIDGAIAADGQHYSAIDAAFLYRKQLIASCTCNGKNTFGLATFDVKSDPTLQPGDMISTTDGIATYTGRSGQSANFTPVNPASLPPDIGAARHD